LQSKSIFFCLVNLLAATLFAQEDPVRREIQKLIRYETNIRYENTPGFIIAMVEKDTTFIFSFGQRAEHDTTPLNESDLFEIGGVTKLYTALLVMHLVDQGKLDLNESVASFMEIPNPTLDSCTLLSLLTHTSGLPKYPANWGEFEKEANNPFAHFTNKELEAFLNGYDKPVKAKPDYLYSHLNFVVLQLIMYKVTGIEYEELLRQVLQPLRLNASTGSTTTVTGYGYDIKIKPPWTAKAYAGSIGIKTSLNDLIRFCKYTLDNKTEFKTLLQRIPMHIGKTQGWVSLGWQVLPVLKNRYVYAHTGRTEGHHSFVGLLPETGTAVIILSNSAHGTGPLGLSILNMMNQNWKRK
jgi:D-alanyl-D-alanine-carboxypeptidase/D-alanyl-D-alanine-endopeptidase